MNTSNSEIVLVLAPTANDGAVTCAVLASSSLSAVAYATANELATRLLEPCGAVVIAEEALVGDAAAALHKTIDCQENWSDLPIILLTGPNTVLSNELFSKSGNISLLERPFSRLTLIRAIEVALRSRKRQYEIRDLLKDLQESRDEADRANSAKSQFLALMSHELRTPLSAIIGFSELVDNPDLNQSDRSQYTETIRRNGRLLSQLIDDTLDLSKVEAGKLTTEHTRCDLLTLLRDVKMILDQQALEKGIALHFQSNEPIPEFITTDSMRLKQILLNIIGNAVKFTTDGRVRVSVQDLRRIDGGRSALAFIVEDTGEGIRPEQQKKLFSPFMQADPSITRKFGGTGLGLALSRRLAEMLGGTIELTESVPTRGSIFTIYIDPGNCEGETSFGLPAKVAEVATIMNGKNLTLVGMSILVAEDSADNRYLINRMLKNEGAEVDFAVDGLEAVQKAQDKHYDVVLMDVQMPNLDGLQATQRLRSQGYQRPIIALTAHAMKEDRDHALRIGCTDHMTKPINFAELIRKVKTHAI